MTLRTCRCLNPTQSTDPRRKQNCARCGWWLDPDADWAANDRTHNAFLDNLELALREAEGWDATKAPPAEWQHFRYLALSRERAGRERFGIDHLNRDNIQAGAEEATDGCNYTYFDTLHALRHGEDVEMDLVLTAAYYDFMAYKTRLRLRGKRHGAP